MGGDQLKGVARETVRYSDFCGISRLEKSFFEVEKYDTLLQMCQKNYPRTGDGDGGENGTNWDVICH